VAEVAKLMVDAGLIVLTAFISPFRAERRLAREILQDGEFIEVFVDTPWPWPRQRDVKGLYKKARSGQLKNFTGIDSPYEAPEAPELRIDTTAMGPVEAAERIVGSSIRSMARANMVRRGLTGPSMSPSRSMACRRSARSLCLG
jgi:bifunctional enzyme CysN/CysC